MKKKFTILLSVLLALVMGLAVISCGDDDDGGISKAQAIDKAVTAVENLYNADGYIGDLHYGKTAQSGSTEFDANIEKRGNKVRLLVGEGGVGNDMIVDIPTGNMYASVAQNGETPLRVVKQIYPANLSEFVLYTINKELANADDERIEEVFDYNASTRTLSLKLDYKNYANMLLEPLYKAYKNRRPVSRLLDDYITLATKGAYDLSDINAFLTTYVQANSDSTVGELVTFLSSLGVDVNSLLAKAGVTLTPEQSQAAMNRTVAEAVIGLGEYFKTIDLGSASTGSNPISLPAVINAVLLQPVTVPDNADNAIGNVLDIMYAALGVIKVNTIVDDFVAPRSPELYTAIVNEVKFSKLKADVDIKFDSDYNISKLTVTAEAAHTYTGTDVEDYMFLIDNDYKIDVVLNVSEYTADAGDFDITFAPVASPVAGTTLVYGDMRNDLALYVEKAGNDLTVVSMTPVFVPSSATTPVLLESGDNITLSADGLRIVIKAAYLRTLFADDPDGVVLVTLDYGDVSVTARVVKMPDNTAKAMVMLYKFFRP